MLLALVCAVMFVGAVAQRLTGMGFALLSAPFVVLLLGPFEGVILVNIAGVAASLFILVRVLRDVEWRTFMWLTVPALLGVVPGALIAVVFDSDWLSLCIGTLLLIVLVKLLWDPQQWPEYEWWAWVLLLTALLIGTVLGDVLSRRIPASVTRITVCLIAAIGSASVAIDGFRNLVAA